MMTPFEIAVLGGGYAGVIAALRLAQDLSARVTLVSDSPVLVERIRLHEAACGRAVRAHPLARWLGRAGVALRVARVEGIDVAAQKLALVRGGAAPYDVLVYAPGSTGDASVPGAREHAFALSVAGARAFASRLRAGGHDAADAVVVGGGLTGIETASELAAAYRSLRVTLVAPRLGDGLSDAGRRYVGHALGRLGVRIVTGERVTEVEPDAVRLASGGRVRGRCIWAAGFRSSPLAARSGLAVNELGQLSLDETLRAVGAPAIIGAGDAAAPAQHRGAAVPTGCKSALQMGAHAARVAAAIARGQTAPRFTYGDVPFCVSLGRRDGLVEWRDTDGAPLGLPITGAAAAAAKELICTATVWSLTAESLCPGSWCWPVLPSPAVGRAA